WSGPDSMSPWWAATPIAASAASLGVCAEAATATPASTAVIIHVLGLISLFSCWLRFDNQRSTHARMQRAHKHLSTSPGMNGAHVGKPPATGDPEPPRPIGIEIS